MVGLRLSKYSPNLKPEDRLQAALHNLTNALAAARSFGEVVALQAKSGTTPNQAVVDSLLQEIDRASEMVRNVRLDTYQPGDVLACTRCGYTFVFRKTSATSATCRRCKGNEVERWKPPS